MIVARSIWAWNGNFNVESYAVEEHGKSLYFSS